MKRRPNPRITNAATIEERKYYQRLPRKSRRIKEAKLLALRRSGIAQTNLLYLRTMYRFCFPDRFIPLVTIGGRYYRETGEGYLSELTHAGYLSELAYREKKALADLVAEGE